MNTVFRTMVLAGAAVTLAACGSCPKSGDYRAVPYEHERTAGNGTVVYDGTCHKPRERSSYAVDEERTVGKADPIFDESLRK